MGCNTQTPVLCVTRHRKQPSTFFYHACSLVRFGSSFSNIWTWSSTCPRLSHLVSRPGGATPSGQCQKIRGKVWTLSSYLWPGRFGSTATPACLKEHVQASRYYFKQWQMRAPCGVWLGPQSSRSSSLGRLCWALRRHGYRSSLQFFVGNFCFLFWWVCWCARIEGSPLIFCICSLLS